MMIDISIAPQCILMKFAVFYLQDYGKIPAYLLKRYKENLLRAEEEYAKLKEMIDNQAKKKMPEAERQSILKVFEHIAALATSSPNQ